MAFSEIITICRNLFSCCNAMSKERRNNYMIRSLLKARYQSISIKSGMLV